MFCLLLNKEHMTATSASLLSGACPVVSYSLCCCWSCWPGERRGADLRACLVADDRRKGARVSVSERESESVCVSETCLLSVSAALFIPYARRGVRAIRALCSNDGTCRDTTARPRFLVHTAPTSVYAIDVKSAHCPTGLPRAGFHW